MKVSVLKTREGTLGVILMLSGSFLIFSGSLIPGTASFFDSKGSADAFAHLYPKSNGVRYRTGGSAIWNDAPVNSHGRIAPGDAVHTGPDAVAKIGLPGGGEFYLQPDSMIVVSRSRQAQSDSQLQNRMIQVKKGHVSFKSNSLRENPILLEVEGKVFALPELPKLAADQVVTVSIQEGSASPKVKVEQEKMLIPNDRVIEDRTVAEDATPVPVDLPAESIDLDLKLQEVSPKNKDELAEISTDSKKSSDESSMIRLTSAEIKKVEIPLPVAPMNVIPDGALSAVAFSAAEQRVEIPVEAPREDTSRFTEKGKKTDAQKVIQTTMTTDSFPALESVREPASKEEKGVGPNEIPSQESDEWSRFGISVRQGFNRIKGIQNSNQSSGYLGSNSSFGLGLSWFLHLNDHCSFFLDSRISKIDIFEIKSQKIVDQSQMTSEFDFGFRREFTSSWLMFDIGNQQTLVYRFTDPTTIKLDRVGSLTSEVGAGWSLFEGKSVFVSWLGAVSFSLPIENEPYGLKNGYGYRTYFRFEQRLRAISFFAEPYYQYSKLSGDAYSFENSDLSLKIGISFSIEN